MQETGPNDPPPGLPRLVRLYIRHVAIGFALSAVFVGLLMWFDIGRLASLIAGTRGGWMALFLLWFFNGLVFAGVQFAIAVMRMAEPETGRGGGTPAAPVASEALPVRIVAGPQRP